MRDLNHVWPSLENGGRRIGYARVSTQDQKLRMQLEALNAVACDEIFSDHGISGANAKRPGLDQALAALESGDVLVVFKLDRLGRSVLHLADLLARFKEREIYFCSLSEGINTTCSYGRMAYQMLSVIAEFQRELIVENTLAGLESARANGSQLGRPPKLDPRDVMHIHECVYKRGQNLANVARSYGVSTKTCLRAFERMGVQAM